jgi:hypothetical protein
MRLCGLSGFDSAWLSEADFGRLLPVCCPEWMSVFGSDPTTPRARSATTIRVQ